MLIKYKENPTNETEKKENKKIIFIRNIYL